MLCKVHSALAYAMLAYVVASAYYVIRTRPLGTPFNDSLTEEQRAIKTAAASARRRIFWEGILLAAVASYFIKPFKACK